MRRTLYLPLLLASALAVVALLAPAGASAACASGEKAISHPPYCEKEPTPPPPPAPTPPPPITTTSIANELESGEVAVTFNFTGPGTLTLKGKAIKGSTIKVNAAGKLEVVLKATGKVLQHLENKGWTNRKQIYATFTAADGTTTTVKVVVRFRKP